MQPVPPDHNGPVVLLLDGYQFHSACSSVFFVIHRIAGELIFTPKAGGLYRVPGFLAPDYQAVWVEGQETCQVMGELTGALLESGERPSDRIICADDQAGDPHCRELVIGEVVRIERRRRESVE